MANQQLGDVSASATARAWFFTTDLEGAPVTVGSLSGYLLKNASATEITAGVTAAANVGHTGVHRLDVDVAAAGLTAGDDAVICYTGTVNGISVRIAEAQFSVLNRTTLNASGVRAAVGLASPNLDTQLDALPTNAELATALGTADDAVLAAIAALNNLSASGLLTTQMTESYAADGVAPTLAQAIFLIQQRLTEFAISGTTTTVKKLDGSTTAAVLTHDDATSPTTSARTS